MLLPRLLPVTQPRPQKQSVPGVHTATTRKHNVQQQSYSIFSFVQQF